MAHAMVDGARVVENILSDVKAAVQRRVVSELQPQIEKIASEEVAKLAIDLSSCMTVERLGMEIRITIRRPEAS